MIRLGELAERVLRGEIRLDYFRRPFRWSAEDVCKLFDSIIKGYPIGGLVVWERPASAGTVAVGPLRLEVPSTPRAWWVLDGQQRLTSIVGALNVSPDTHDPRFRIFFDLDSDSFVSASAQEPIPAHWLPLGGMSSTVELLSALQTSVLDDRHIEQAVEIAGTVREYPIPVSTVHRADKDAPRETFTRLNASGKPLTRTQLSNALNAGAPDFQPTDLAGLSTIVRGLGFGEFDQATLSASVAALDEGLTRDADPVLEIVGEALAVVVEFLRDRAGIPHLKLLPDASVVPVLTRFVVRFGPPDQHVAELLSRWIWRGAALTTRPDRRTVASGPDDGAVHTDPEASARRLLAMLPDDGALWAPDPRHLGIESAAGRVNLLAMLAAKPRIIVAPEPGAEPGNVVEVIDLLDTAHSPVTQIVPDVNLTTDSADSLSNGLVHPPSGSDAILRALTTETFPPEVLASHHLDLRDIDLLRGRRFDEFFERRGDKLRREIGRYVDQRAKWSFRDQPVGPLFDDDEEFADAG
jgi:hypothetical protein